MTKIFLMILLFSTSVLAEPNYSFKGKNYLKDLNFGVLVNNNSYTLYRSEKLGKSDLKKLYSHLKKKGLPLPKTIVFMNKNGYGGYASLWMDNAIEEYEARVKYGYEYFHSFRYDYRTYLDGENPYEPSSDIDDKKWLSSKAIKYFGYREDNKADGGVDAFIRIMELVLDPQRQPVLFHCQGGRHRTGMVAMAIRTLQGGEWLEVKGNMNKAEYEYYMHNKTMFRQSNLDFIREFSSSEPKFFEWLGKYGTLLNSSN